MLYGNEVEAKIKKKVKKTETRHVKRKKRRTASVSERVENKLKLTSNFDRIKVISFDVSPRVARSWILLMMIFGCFVLPWLSRDANQQLDTRDNILHFKHFVSSLSLAFYFNYDKYFFYYKHLFHLLFSSFACLLACLQRCHQKTMKKNSISSQKESQLINCFEGSRVTATLIFKPRRSIV